MYRGDRIKHNESGKILTEVNYERIEMRHE